MNRKDWEKQVFKMNLHPTAKLVALVAGSFGNWNEERTVWAGTSVISDMTGLTRDTVQKYVDEFVEQGWLKKVGMRKRATEYELCHVVAEPFGILAKTPKKMNPASLAKLKVGKDVPVAEPTEPIAETTGNALPNVPETVADGFGTILKEHKEENLKEHKDKTPAAPVDALGEDGEVDHPSLTTESEKVVKFPMSGPARKDFDSLFSNTYRSASEKQKAQAKEIIESKPGSGNFYEDVKQALRATGMEIDDVW